MKCRINTIDAGSLFISASRIRDHMSPWQRTARKMGEKEPRGMTKSRILLYIAGCGETDFYGLRLYMKRSLNISNAKVIRKHLEELEALSLISRKPVQVGESDYYLNSFFLGQGFDSFRRVFKYLKSHGLEKEFMLTGHYRDYISSEDFTVKLYLNIFKRNLLDICDYLQTEEGCERARREVIKYYPRPDAMLNLVRGINSRDTSDVFIRDVLVLVEELKCRDVDSVYDLVSARLTVKHGETGFGDACHILRLSGSVIPAEKRDTMTELLLLSPSAMDYALTPGFSDTLLVSSVFIGYYLTMALIDPGHKPCTPGRSSDGGPADDPYGYPDGVPESNAIYQIIKSLFISDLVYGGLAPGEVSDRLIAGVFS